LCGHEVDPHAKDKDNDLLVHKRGHVGNPKSLGPRVSQKPIRKLSRRRQVNVEKPMKEGNNEACRRDFKQNTERGS
jgi:hypothetical protein